MKKAALLILSIVLVLLSSCAIPESIKTKLIGTWYAEDSISGYEILSYDGTYIHQIDYFGYYRTEVLSLQKDSFEIEDSPGYEYSYGFSGNDLWIQWGFVNMTYEKISSSIINMSGYSVNRDPHLVGLWTSEGNSPITYDIKQDGSFIRDDGDSSFSSTWTSANSRITLDMGLMGLSASYAIVDDIAFIDGDWYTKVDLPSYAEPDNKLKASLVGTWMYIDPVTDETTGYYVFDFDNTVWMVDSSGRYNGTWSIVNGVFKIDVGSMHFDQIPILCPDDSDSNEFIAFKPSDIQPASYSWNKLSSNLGYIDNYRDEEWQSLNLVDISWYSSDRSVLFNCKQTNSTLATMVSNGIYQGVVVSWYMDGSLLHILNSDDPLIEGVYMRYKDDYGQEVLHVDGMIFIGSFY